MPHKSPKRNCKRRYQKRAAGRRRGSGRAWEGRGYVTGPTPSCPTCPLPPSVRPSRAASLRYRRWRLGGAAAGGWSWSGAAWTWSASYAPTVTRTSRWTSATASDPLLISLQTVTLSAAADSVPLSSRGPSVSELV